MFVCVFYLSISLPERDERGFTLKDSAIQVSRSFLDFPLPPQNISIQTKKKGIMLLIQLFLQTKKYKMLFARIMKKNNR